MNGRFSTKWLQIKYVIYFFCVKQCQQFCCIKIYFKSSPNYQLSFGALVKTVGYLKGYLCHTDRQYVSLVSWKHLMSKKACSDYMAYKNIMWTWLKIRTEVNEEDAMLQYLSI